tara:strand:- start:690 stop:1118 length:429 start_codon:yes stop_codon:yes gene_type:complete
MTVTPNQEQTIDYDKYLDFVYKTTSAPSTDFHVLKERIDELQRDGADVARLATAAFGLSAEAGEFTEIVKKIILQGKPYSEENIFHMKRELGDIMWYMAQACMALDTTLDEVLKMNYEKLSDRFPEGYFDVYRSENRAKGDV